MTPRPGDRAISLMFHDVVDADDFAQSGFSTPGADLYKLERQVFNEHLDGIRKTPSIVGAATNSRPPFYLTFDDGGISAHSIIAPMLEARGWRGHFFVTTDRIGTRGFLSSSQVKELAERGHVIGSHSCSHPARISACTPDELRREWEESVAVLSGIIDAPVTVASVPGGFYSTAVGEAAARAGVTVLFTSEPTTRVDAVAGCVLLGRYAIWRSMRSATSGSIASGAIAPRLRQSVWWTLKRGAKAIPGDPYAKIRSLLLRR
jgi:polysaccharide deacetylase